MMGSKQAQVQRLRDAIAEAIGSNVKSYNVPRVCTKFGIQDVVKEGDADEAHLSKKTYVKKRLLDLSQHELLKIAIAMLDEYEDNELSSVVSIINTGEPGNISQITRRGIIKLLNNYNPLFNDVDLYEGLNTFTKENLTSSSNIRFYYSSLEKDIEQHYIKNDDYTNEELLKRCGILECSQKNFLTFLEKMLDPVVRRDTEQEKLAAKLNELLRPDGYSAIITAYQSGHPVYALRHHEKGVKGNVKNLIFASVGAKPEFILTDAINNDVVITHHADKCLVYDEIPPPTGLKWDDMVGWWQRRENIIDSGEARNSLGKRLLRSVKMTGSPGEVLIFETYFKRFQKKYSRNLPALIPQVYLHLDPLSQKERETLSKPRALERQRGFVE
ncbi:hypothetical protein N5580_22325 (plasmid) [Pantoea piersonii]|uniref:AbiJ-NTD3 domain-containing protein n=1 Tax=Pantoea piersonii TaxID=2364647 RepID=A0AAJ5QR55_9GAMM|nr:hypothetical protein [Pantoea piersonii]WBG93554.1 hypothetical protein N5580_22325 [Pantoea piersonii]